MDITVQELHKKLADGEKFIFIDVREPWEYEEFNLGAQLVPMNTFHEYMAALEPHRNEEIVLHCRSGARSGMVKSMMESNGYSNVRNLLGGVLEWRSVYGNK